MDLKSSQNRKQTRKPNISGASDSSSSSRSESNLPISYNRRNYKFSSFNSGNISIASNGKINIESEEEEEEEEEEVTEDDSSPVLIGTCPNMCPDATPVLRKPMSSFSSDEDDRPLCKRFKSISTKPMGAGKSTLASSKKSSSKIVSSDRSQEGDPKKSGSTQTRIAIILGGNPQTKASLASGQRSKVPTTKEVPIIGKPTQSSIPVLLVSSSGSLKKSIAAELRALDSDDSDDNEESPFITLASNLPPDENCLEEDLSTYLETIKSMKTKGMAMFEDEAAIANLKECLEVLSSRATHPNIGPKVKMAIDIANDNLPTLHKMYHSAIPTRTFFEKKLRDNEEIKRKLDHLRKEGKELAPMIGTHNKRIDSLEQQILKLQEELRLEKEALTPLGKKFDQVIIHGMSLKKRRATLKKEILAEQAEYDKALKDYAKVKSQISEFFGMF